MSEQPEQHDEAPEDEVQQRGDEGSHPGHDLDEAAAIESEDGDTVEQDEESDQGVGGQFS